MERNRRQNLLENYAANFIIHTRANGGMDPPEESAVDRFNARAMANDPFRGGANPILSRINGFQRNPNLLDADPEPELDMYRNTLQLSEPVEFDTLAQAFDEMGNQSSIAETHTPVVPVSPATATDDLIDRLALAFKKN